MIYYIYKQIEFGKINSDVLSAIDADLISSLEESRYCYGIEDGYMTNSIVAKGVDALVDSQPNMKCLNLLEYTFQSELDRFKTEHQNFTKLYQIYNLKFYEKMALLYMKLIKFTKEFLNTVQNAKLRIGQ